MFRLAIVEDDDSAARLLEGYVARYSREYGAEIQAARFGDGLELTQDYRAIWDIILMDIEMPHQDGMAAARLIRAQDPAVVLIFITNMARYAIRGYEVDAMDFVLKPVKYAQFALKLRKALNIAARRERRYLMLNVDGESRRLAADEIAYIEVFNHQLQLHTRERVYTARGSLQDMEAQLAGSPFTRCSHSFLVNLAHVTGIRRGALLVQGQEIPISRAKQKEVLEKLSDYMGGGLR